MRFLTTFAAMVTAACIGSASAQSRTPFRITDATELEVYQPKLSPDGNWVAYLWHGPTYGDFTLRVRRVDGTGVRNIFTNPSTSTSRVIQFNWQQRSTSTSSELLWVARSGFGCDMRRSNPQTGHLVTIFSSVVNDILMPNQPCGDTVVAVGLGFDSSYRLLRNGPGGSVVNLYTTPNLLYALDVSPDGTHAIYFENATGGNYTNQVWSQQIAVAPYTRTAVTAGGNPPNYSMGGFISADHQWLTSSMSTRPWQIVHADLGGLEAWTHNGFVDANWVSAHPGHLASPARGKDWLAMAAAEVPASPITLPDPYLVALMPPAQGGLVWLYQSQPGSRGVTAVSMDRDASKVAFLEYAVGSATNSAIYVLALDRELSVVTGHDGNTGKVVVSVPCDAGEVCLLGGANGLVSLPATMPGLRGEIWLDSTWSLLMAAIGDGSGPIEHAILFPNSSALVGASMYFQAMRTNATLTTGDISRVVQLRWF